MFRESANARYILRAAVAAAIAMAAVAGTIWINNPVVQLISAGVGALAAYLGIGAVSGSVEPFVGKTLDGAVVPADAILEADPTLYHHH